MQQNVSQPFGSVTFINAATSKAGSANITVLLAKDNRTISIRSTALHLRYRCGSRFHDAGALHVDIISPGPPLRWQPPASVRMPLTSPGNLNGSVQTTDCYLNAEACVDVYQNRFQPGLLSRTGWELIDDSASPWIDPKTGWRVERTTGGLDWWLFGHRSDYRGALRDFVTVAGKVAMMPWRAYGVWWSRYYAYNETGIKDVIAGYRARDLPLHMVVLDMDWHAETPDPGGEPPGPLAHCNTGWGGYTWNRTLFPDPEAFQRDLHRQGLQLTLNTHDQCGIQRTQGLVYRRMAAAMGLPVGSHQTVQCHLQNKSFTDALYAYAMGSDENQMVDYWWTGSFNI